MLRLVSLSGLLLLVPVIPALAQTTGISGRITDATGLPLVGAQVSVAPIPNGLSRLVLTGPDGRFEISGLALGPHALTASAAGFERVTREIQAGAGPVSISLSPAPRIETVTVVSASRQDQLRDELSSRVDVVSRARLDVERQSVGDVLREIPGLLARRGSEGAGPAGQQIQGIDARQAAVLVDGQPVIGARGIKSGAVNLDRQPIDQLERIEVVKGAASALFGSDAIGGVVNFITRDAQRPAETSANMSFGSLDMKEVGASAGIALPTAGWFLTGTHRSRNSFDLTPTTADVTGAEFSRDSLFGKANLRFQPAFGLKIAASHESDATRGVIVGETGPLDSEIDERGNMVHATMNWQAGSRVAIEARGYVTGYEEQSLGRSLTPGQPEETGRLNQAFTKADATAGIVAGSRQFLQAGLEWSRDSYEGINRLRDPQGHRAETAVAWAQDRISLTNRMTATIGARFDHHSIFGSAVSPKAGLSVRATEQVRLRLSYGRGFRAPDLGQLYYRYLPSINVYQVIGNPELTSERSSSWQAGGEFASTNGRLRVGANLFRNEVDDLIEAHSLGMVTSASQLQALYASGDVDPSFSPALFRLLFVYRNVADVRTQGAEVDGEVVVGFGLRVAAAYTYLEAMSRQTGQTLTGRHPHQGFARATWMSTDGATRAEVRGAFYSGWLAAAARGGSTGAGTYAPRFALWDVTGSQRIAAGVSAYVAIDNFLDSQDPNTGVVLANGTPATIYRPEAGRVVRGGLTWRWEKR